MGEGSDFPARSTVNVIGIDVSELFECVGDSIVTFIPGEEEGVVGAGLVQSLVGGV